MMLPQLQIPQLQTPARPRPSERAFQPSPKPSSQFTIPTLPTQRPKPLQSKSTHSSIATDNSAVSTLDNITVTNRKKTQAEKSSTEVMDIQENVGAIPPTAAAASSNQDQPVEGDQHSQQQSDPQLQENTDQGSELVNTYSGGYNANGGTGAEGYVYGEYNGDMLSEEFARGQMVVRSCASMHILCYI